jgi:methylphosphotriester-DNA--protein-cysteine methyltransferase
VAKKIYYVIKNNAVIKSSVPGRYAGWKKGKIFGRLNCGSGKKMKKENRVFFLSWKDAINSGYRPCKKCKPAPKDTY